MAIDFDALDLVRTQNKAKMYEQQQKRKKRKKDQIYFEGVDKLNKLANAYDKAANQGIKEVYKNKWLELVKIYAAKTLKNFFDDEDLLSGQVMQLIKLTQENIDNNNNKQKEVEKNVKQIRKTSTVS